MKSETVKPRLSLTKLGKIMLEKFGKEACQSGYRIKDPNPDPKWVGFYALQFGDINRDGTTN